MRIKPYYACILPMLILLAGCQKQQPTSVTVNNQAKAATSLPGFPLSYQNAGVTQRVIAFDNGSGLNCFLAYDLGTEQVSMIQASGGSYTALWSTTGLNIDGQIFHFGVTSYATYDAPMDEVSGTHMIALDFGQNGHLSYLLVYIPGSGIAMLLQNMGNGAWHSLFTSYSGIGGYDLKNGWDKIIAYDLGSGHKNSLICYRPFNGVFWVLQNQPNATNPVNWVAVVKSSGGVGGFDLKGIEDNLIAVDNTPGNMDLVCYRPGNGYIWYLNHQANTTLWTTKWTSRTGFTGTFDFSQWYDRMVPYDADGTGTQNYMFCWRAGSKGYDAIVKMSGSGFAYKTPGGDFSSYPMQANPTYVPPGWSGAPGYADHIVPFAGNSYGLGSILCYEPGDNLADIYLLNNPGASSFTFAY